MNTVEAGFAAAALLVLICACGAVYYSRTNLQRITQTVEDSARPPLYLPQARYVRLVTLGYDTFFSKLLWFGTINYFGKQFAGNQDYRWLGNMCELVTVLDAKATHVVEFCGTLLAWVAKDPRKAEEILSAAIKSDPNRWRIRYLRGFTYWYFLERLDLAKEDFVAASNLPDAPAFLAGMASRLVADDHGPTLARQFLEEMVANTTDPAAKKALKSKLKKARLSEAVFLIETALDSFRRSESRDPSELSELVTRGYLSALPTDPYKGTFILQDGQVVTTSGKKGLAFGGKTAKTGIMKDEFRDLKQ